MKTWGLVSAAMIVLATGSVSAVESPASKGGLPVPKESPREISANVAKLLGLEGKRILRPAPADYTSFQSGGGYAPEHDMKSDIAIVYTPAKEPLDSWAREGYRIHCMWGPRAGKDWFEGKADGQSHLAEVQTMRNGTPLGHSGSVYYGTPGPQFTKMAIDTFFEAIKNGVEAVVPEEPEYFSQSGYCQFFKDEWAKYYNRPWEDQVTSVQARYDSSRLKAELETRFHVNVFRAVKEKHPDIQCIVAEHSPVNYGAWGIVCPHAGIIKIPEVDGIIGQVWTGTSRSACKYQGKNEERTFENAFLEYSSLHNLVRETGKKLWFLMDPVEDYGERTMEDYQANYERTLIASLLFPEVSRYEVMPWPSRIFGRVPYTTEITTIISALNDMHNQKEVHWDAGTQGIGTFVSDTIMWQRGDPKGSTMDSFYGITLPLLMKGVPIQVAQLERAAEKDYLKPYKVLFLSYDMMKPTDPAIHDGLARWVKDGGTLVLLGGNDPYNEVNDWWKKAGFATPQADLLKKLGIQAEPATQAQASSKPVDYKIVLEEDRPIRDLANRKVYEIDLSPFLVSNKTRAINVRFTHARGDGGWGAWVRSLELTVDGKARDSFRVGSPEENRYLIEDRDSGISGEARFADRDSHFTYRFKVPQGRDPVLKVEMGNQFRVGIAKSTAADTCKLIAAATNTLTKSFPAIEVRTDLAPVEYRTGAETLYRVGSSEAAAAFTTRAGKGHFVFCGLPAKYYADSVQGASLMRGLARYALALQGEGYRESKHLSLRRGSYFIARSFDGTLTIPGRWVNLLDPKLPVVNSPKVPAGALGLFYDAGKTPAKPRLLYASSKIEARNETGELTAFLISGPKGTPDAARIETAGRKVKTAKAYDADGNAIEATFTPDGDTILAGFMGLPKGAVVRVEWEK